MDESQSCPLSPPPAPPNPRIHFWLKLWGVGMMAVGVFAAFVQVPWETLIFIVAYGAALIWGKQIYALRQIGLFFVAFLVFATLVGTYFHIALEPQRFRALYFFLSSLFYLALFIFLLTPEVKKAFGPSPFPKKPPPVLTKEEERRIKFWVRIVALALIIESLVDNIFSDWFRRHGFPAGGKVSTALGLIAAVGLLLFKQNIGRRFGLFVCFATWYGVILVGFQQRFFGIVGYSYAIATFLLCFAAFLFLLHPKTKAVFK